MPRDGDFSRLAKDDAMVAIAAAQSNGPPRSEESIMKQRLTAAQNKAKHNYECAILAIDVDALTTPIILANMKSKINLTTCQGHSGDLHQRCFIGVLMKNVGSYMTDSDPHQLRLALIEKCECVFGRKLTFYEIRHIMSN